MTTRIEAVWTKLLDETPRQHPHDGAFKVILLDETSNNRIYAGLSQSNEPLLALGLKERPPEISISSAALSYFRKERDDGSWLMVLKLLHPKLATVFGRLCQDLVDEAALVQSEAELVSLFRQRLELWQRLFEEAAKGPMEKHKVKGLIAELLTLEALLTQYKGQEPQAISAWHGPEKSDQDFQFADHAIEVKAIAPDASEVSISSLNQLDADIPLELRVLTLCEATNIEKHFVNLPIVVARIETKLSDTPHCLNLFRKKIREAGYFEQEVYEQYGFVLQSIESYLVSEQFPKLTSSVVPAEVTKATYALRLMALKPFALSGQYNNE
jgi:hypothetical protein